MRRRAAWLALLTALGATHAAAQGYQKHRLYVTPGWPISRAGFDIDCANQKSWPALFLSSVTTTRASVAMEDNSDGSWYSFPPNALRITSKGCLVEEARTNSLHNSAAAGSAPGSPGTLSTGWTSSLPSGLTQTVNSSVTKNGITFLSVTYAGTATSTANIIIVPGNLSDTAALYGQTWTGSIFAQITAGSAARGWVTGMDDISSGSAVLAGATQAAAVSTALQRFQQSRTATNAATAFMRLSLQMVVQSGDVISITFLIGLPQLEVNSLINSTLASATVATGGACTNGAGQVFAIVGGVGTPAATVTGTVTAGALAGALTVSNAGNYTTFPPGPASTTGGTCTVQPTINLVPASKITQSFATSPIVTTSAAATRAADVISTSLPRQGTSSSGYSLMAIGSPEAPTLYGVNQIAAQIDDGPGAANRVQIARNGAGASFASEIVASVQAAAASTTWNMLDNKKITGYASPTAINVSFNNGVPVAAALAGPGLGINTLRFGENQGGGAQFNGYLSRIVVAPSNLLSN